MDTDNSKQLKPGHLLQGGKYQITRFLGQGSFGITYLAEHTYLGKKVAIKEFFMKELNNRGDDGSITGMSDSSLSYNYCQKFKKEAINLSQLEHPNIVNVSDLFTENGTFYYVMDFIEGLDLKKYIVKHPLSEGEAVNIIKCVAEALIYMHETKRMLHLDLKPGNIMRRDSDGHIFLIDFGLSKHFDKNGEPESSTTIGGGTPGYAPIEQANQAKNGEFRPTIDVYALGATLYKLLTGATPPDASILVSDPKLIESNLRSKGISDNLIDTVVASMRPSVYERIQTIRDFLESLNGSNNEDETLFVHVDDEPEDKETAGDQAQIYAPKANSTSTNSIKKYALIACIMAVLVGGVVWLSSGGNSDAALVEQTLPDSVVNARMTINGNLCYYTGEVTYKEPDTIAIANGKGEASFDNGNYYKGSFSNGLMHGDNAYYKYANGDTFRGSFTNNLFTKGKYTSAENGDYFEGTFDNQGQPKKGWWHDKNGNYLESIGGAGAPAAKTQEKGSNSGNRDL